MTAVTMVVAVDPVLQKRATVYLWTDGSFPIWREVLADSGYAEEIQELQPKIAVRLNYYT